MPTDLRVIGSPDLLFHIQPPIMFQGFIPHTHYVYEIAYFSHGSGSLIYNGREIEMAMPQLHICPPQPAWHGFVTTEFVTTASMTIHPELLGRNTPTLSNAPQPLLLLDRLAKKHDPLIKLGRAAATRVQQIIELLCEEYRLQLDGCLMRVASLVQEMLVLAVREEQGLHIHPTEDRRSRVAEDFTADKQDSNLAYDRDPRIVRALDIIRSNTQKPLDNATLAKRTSMREKYFIRLFTNEVGISPQRYFLTLRLEASAEYLVGSSLSIDEIARKFGFKHRSHFQVAFRQYFKMTPSQYQYIHRSGNQWIGGKLTAIHTSPKSPSTKKQDRHV